MLAFFFAEVVIYRWITCEECLGFLCYIKSVGLRDRRIARCMSCNVECTPSYPSGMIISFIGIHRNLYPTGSVCKSLPQTSYRCSLIQRRRTDCLAGSNTS
jgi:hypothetical protein